MCRLAAYLGPEIPLGRLLLEPPGSPARGTAPGGHGLGWYAPDDMPAVYTSALPPAHDPNLPHLARSLSADLWLAVTEIPPATRDGCPADPQPCHDDALLFALAGAIDGFALNVRPALRRRLAPEIEAHVHGGAEAGHLFALLRQLLHEDPDLPMDEALRMALHLVEGWCAGATARLTLVVADGELLYAVRHALGAPCPELHYTADDEAFPEGQLVASAPLTDTGYWQPVPEHHLLVLDPEEPPELSPL